MGKFVEIDEKLQTFIGEQQMFFVATAAPDGRVSLSPKGRDSLRVLDPKRIVWLNLTGSENETAAHLLESPRISLMWCSFTERPLILRVYGKAHAVHPRDAAWDALSALFPPTPGARQIFEVDVELVMTSCGFAVPRFDYIGQRDTLLEWAEARGEEGVRKYWVKRNQTSIDGRPTGILADAKPT